MFEVLQLSEIWHALLTTDTVEKIKKKLEDKLVPFLGRTFEFL